MSALILGLALVAGFAQAPERPLVWVVSQEPIDNEAAAKWRPIADDKLVETLVSQGYEQVKGKRATYLFTPDFGLRNGEKAPELYRDLTQAIDKNGVLDPSKSTALKEYLDYAMGSMLQHTGVEDAKYAVTLWKDLYLWDGQKELNVSSGGRPSDEARKALEESPLGPKDGSIKQRVEFSDAYRPLYPSKMALRRARGYSDPDTFNSAWVEVTEILRDRSVKLRAALKQEKTKFYDKLGIASEVLEFEKMDRDMKATALPEPYSSQLDFLLLEGEYKRSGFNSLEEAQAFRQRARVGSTSARLSITAYLGKNGWTSFGLP